MGRLKNLIAKWPLLVLSIVGASSCAIALYIFALGLSYSPISNAARVSQTPVEKIPYDKMIDVNDAPKVYVADGITLAFKSGKSTSGDPSTVLTVTAPTGERTQVVGEIESHRFTRFGVGRIDPSNPISEILLDQFTEGAHCCDEIKILEFRAHMWRLLDVATVDGGVDFPIDINGDGVPDIILSDKRFAYAFTSFAESWMPPTVFDLRNGSVIDVSSSGRYRALFESDMEKAKKSCLARDGDQNGACAGYVADAARIGEFRSAWNFMLANYDKKVAWDFAVGCTVPFSEDTTCPAGFERKSETYPEALAWFLVATGYISESEARAATAPNIVCKPPILDFPALFFSSPFAVTGNCYRLAIMAVNQWIDDKSGLANVYLNTPFFVDFHEPPKQSVFLGSWIVRGEGAYQYPAADGSFRTVPRVEFLGKESQRADAEETSRDRDGASTVPALGTADAMTASPSFDCSKAEKDAERLVCKAPELMTLDRQMAALYEKVLSSTTNVRATRTEQRQWLLLSRNSCHDQVCLSDIYNKRIQQLQAQAGQ